MLKLILKLILSLSLIFFVFQRINLRDFFDILSSIHFLFPIIAALLYFTALFVNAVKWFQLLKFVNLTELFLLTLVAQYYTLILFGQLAGEAIKAYKLGKGRQEAEQIAASVIIDRIIGFVGVMVVGIVGLTWSRTDMAKHLMSWFALAMAIFAGGLYLFHLHSFDQAIRKFLKLVKKSFHRTVIIVDQCLRLIDAWKCYLGKPFVLLKSLLLGIVFQFICVCINLVFAKSLNINISFFDWCWIFGVITIIIFLPVTIGGVGLREGGFVFLLGTFGVPAEKALALSLSIFGLQLFGALIGGIVDFCHSSRGSAS